MSVHTAPHRLARPSARGSTRTTFARCAPKGSRSTACPIGKHLHRSKFEHSLPLGPTLTELAFGYDVGGTPFLAWWDEWRRDALGDIHQRPDLVDARRAGRPAGHRQRDRRPRRHRRQPVAGVLAKFARAHGRRPRANAGCARRLRSRSRAWCSTNRSRTARAKGFRNLAPLSAPAPLAYLLHNSHIQRAFMEAALAAARRARYRVGGVQRRRRARASSRSTSNPPTR